jgi:hypothetical protein
MMRSQSSPSDSVAAWADGTEDRIRNQPRGDLRINPLFDQTAIQGNCVCAQTQQVSCAEIRVWNLHGKWRKARVGSGDDPSDDVTPQARR